MLCKQSLPYIAPNRADDEDYVFPTHPAVFPEETLNKLDSQALFSRVIEGFFLPMHGTSVAVYSVTMPRRNIKNHAKPGLFDSDWLQEVIRR